jgi:DNA-binding ferritin-like protein
MSKQMQRLCEQVNRCLDEIADRIRQVQEGTRMVVSIVPVETAASRHARLMEERNQIEACADDCVPASLSRFSEM